VDGHRFPSNSIVCSACVHLIKSNQLLLQNQVQTQGQNQVQQNNDVRLFIHSSPRQTMTRKWITTEIALFIKYLVNYSNSTSGSTNGTSSDSNSNSTSGSTNGTSNGNSKSNTNDYIYTITSDLSTEIFVHKKYFYNEPPSLANHFKVLNEFS